MILILLAAFIAHIESSYPFLQVRGNHYEVGFQIGSHFKDRFKTFFATDPGMIEQKHDVYFFLVDSITIILE